MENTIKELMATTIDNPFDPFTEHEKWNNFDQQKGYHTDSLIARYANFNSDMTELEEIAATNYAVEIICGLNLCGFYKMVSRDVSAYND